MEENRVEAGVREWREHMKRLSDLFDESITHHPNIKKAQLEHFREVVKRPLPDMSWDEKMMLNVLKAEIKRMEKALYPSRLVRMVRRVGRVLGGTRNAKPTTAQVRPQVVIKDAASKSVKYVTTSLKPIAKSLGKKQPMKHDLLPKKRERLGQGIKHKH